MSELEALLVIHGAIDRAVVEDRSKAEIVARYYGPYADGAAVGWFDQFVSWTAEMTGIPAGDLYPMDHAAVSDAIGQLAELTTPSPYMQARRMLATAVAAHVLSGTVINTAEELDGALSFSDNAADLRGLLTNKDVFAAAEDWPRLIHIALEAHLVTEGFAIQNSAAPCVGEVVTVKIAGTTVEAAALKTEYCTEHLRFEDAIKVLDPWRWPACNPLWCELKPSGRHSPAGNPIYHEVVSLDCQHQPETWTAACDLEFTTFEAPGVKIISYDLEAGRPKAGDPILVDSGSLEVKDMGPNGVCVTTTKRIQFAYPFSGEALAMVACALGYGCVGEALLWCCAHSDSPPPPDHQTQPRKKKNHRTGGGAQPSSDPIQVAVGAAKRCIEDCAESYQASYMKAQSGRYTADDVVKDTTAMWSRMMRDATMALEFGVLASRAMAAKCERRPVPNPDEGE